MSDRALLEPPASSARPHGEAAAAELRKSISETQQKRCQRRCRNLRSGHAYKIDLPGPRFSLTIGAAQVHRTVHFSPSFLTRRYALPPPRKKVGASSSLEFFMQRKLLDQRLRVVRSRRPRSGFCGYSSFLGPRIGNRPEQRSREIEHPGVKEQAGLLLVR